jgi:hypothetical protein
VKWHVDAVPFGFAADLPHPITFSHICMQIQMLFTCFLMLAPLERLSMDGWNYWNYKTAGSSSSPEIIPHIS